MKVFYEKILETLQSFNVFNIHVTSCKLHSQKNDKKINYTYRIREEKGDLNKDKLKDIVIVDLNQKDESIPPRMRIFFAQGKNHKFKLIVSTTKLIESQYPKAKNGKYNGENVPEYFIEKAVLQVVTDTKNRKSRYIFKYTNGNFELNYIERILLLKKTE